MAENEEDVSIEELQVNLGTYREQLHHVVELLAVDPGNSEYEEVKRSLEEVIELTQDLLSSAEQTEAAEWDTRTSLSAFQQHAVDLQNGLSSRQRVSRVPQGDSGRLPVGSKVQAVWSEDGEWYDATIEAVTLNGYFVTYDGWGNKEEVDVANVRDIKVEHESEVEDLDAEADTLVDAEREAEVTRLAIKRKIAQAAEVDVLPRDLPPKLRINADDTEDIKAAKRKKIHAFKSKVRLEQLEITQNKRQNAWQQFQNTKGKSKKVGFFTGRKRESIFKSPDDPKGKVGVTGSGKGITEFQKREKHLHLKLGNEEADDL
eukprot:c26887_g1_i2 orf=527-1477(-)